MQTLSHRIRGTECLIHRPEPSDSLAGFWGMLGRAPIVALDTETTGLDTFSPGHKVRLVQFGTATEAWVLPVAGGFVPVIREALAQGEFVAHNATYDLLVLDRHGLARLEDLGPRVHDTRVMAHLLDPRSKAEGGYGHSLKELAAVFVDPAAPDGQRELHKVFRAMKLSIAEGWAAIPVDHPDYVRYAGLDVLLTARLHEVLAALIAGSPELFRLLKFEEHLQGLLARMERRGMLIDVDYTRRLKDRLRADEGRYEAVAQRYGVTSVNSPKQVAEALGAMGEVLTDKTPSGALSVGKEVLLTLADLDRDWQRIGAREPNPLADAIVRCKRAGKWATTYADAFLTMRDGADRLHPSIGSLQARTARMSVSRPPLQQLPSSDWTIRRAFIADPGHLIFASDYAQVEMRVLAALAHEETMKAAIASGVDLHDFTAAKVFGEQFTKAQRKVAKAIGFGKVYGGGATSIARQTGADLKGVQAAISAYDDTYPGVRRYAGRLQRRAQYGRVEVVTPSGRHLPLDRQRLYAATNYVVQSTARDLLAQAIVDLFDQGLGDYLLLPIHDELLGQAPADVAEEVAHEVGRVMESTFFGVEIKSDPEVLGPSWGHGYGAKE
jgi:DNA polymerase-1